MKKLLSTLALSLIFFSGLQGTEFLNCEQSIEQSLGVGGSVSATSYANSSQAGILPNGTIRLTELDGSAKGVKLSENGGVIVRARGSYLVSYRVLVNTQTTLALFKNEDVLPTSAFSNTAALSPVGGTIVMDLDRGDEITIRNIDATKSINTVVSAGAMVPPIPVSLTIVRL